MASLYTDFTAAASNVTAKAPLTPYGVITLREAYLLLSHNIPVYNVSTALSITKITTEEQLDNLATEIMFDTESTAVKYLVEKVTSHYAQARQIIDLHADLKAQYPHYFL